MTLEELDPLWGIAALLFMAVFMAGMELAQMTVKRKSPRKPRGEYVPGAKVVASIVLAFLVAILLMYVFGSEPPI